MTMLLIEGTGRKMGRRAKNYYSPTTGKQYDGFYKRPGDNRWTIAATGETFRCDDEFQAITRFENWQRSQRKEVALFSHEGLANGVESTTPAPTWDASYIPEIPKSALAAYFRNELINNAQEWANLTGLPQLANFRDMPLPRASIAMSTLLENYKQYAEVTTQRKVTVETTWNLFVEVTAAQTLRDLTTAAVVGFKDQLLAKKFGPETIKQYFSRITTVIGFGLERGLDAVEIRKALDCCEVLTAPKAKRNLDENPITPEDFQKLLTAATGNDLMTAALLLALNGALKISEVLSVEWSEIDFKTGTFCTLRGKTGMVRAAVLWPRTIEAIKKLPRKGTHLFVSNTGLAHSVFSLRRMFNELRTAAGVEHVTFDWMRDGAATACVTQGVSPDCYKLIMGHALSGDMDNYARRNPAMVKPACTAVERTYFPTEK